MGGVWFQEEDEQEAEGMRFSDVTTESQVWSWGLSGVEENMTNDHNNTTAQELDVLEPDEGIVARMNVDFLFKAHEEVREDAGGTELFEEEEGEGGTDDGASCCPAPSSPCEVISQTQKSFFVTVILIIRLIIRIMMIITL